jgi:hypothetical protein
MLNIQYIKSIRNQFKKCFVGLFLLCVFATNIFAHGSEHFTWTTLNTSGLYDLNNGRFLQNFDLNYSFFLFNCGVSYKNITYINSDKISIYAGIGLGNLMQFQYGITGDGVSVRGRYDILLGFVFPKFAKKNPYLGLIAITPTIERYFKNSEMDWYFGLGIGYSINNAWGLDYFK